MNGPAESGLSLVMLDCDGTIVDSQTTICDVMSEAFQAAGHQQPTREAIKRVVGLDLLESIQRLSPELPSARHAVITDNYRERFGARRINGQILDPLYPGARDAIEEMSQRNWLLGVATGKSRPGLDAVLASHDLGSYFITRQTSDVAPGKPNPEMLFRALRETGADIRGAVMVGDTTFDMEMARNAGMRAIGVAWGYHPQGELMEAGASLIVDSYGELPGAVEKLIHG